MASNSSTDWLAEAKARLAAATPGPWVWGCQWAPGTWPRFRLRDMVGPSQEEINADCEFMNHAPDDLARCFALIDEQQKVIAEYGALEKTQDAEIARLRREFVAQAAEIERLRARLTIMRAVLVAAGMEEKP